MAKKRKSCFPILINLDEYPTLLVGGGPVAMRKLSNLLEFGARPDIIAMEITDQMMNLIVEYKLDYKIRKYEEGDIEGYKLVFCAIDDPISEKMIRSDSEKYCALLNVADVSELSNFIMPSVIKRGDFVVALSSQGKAPFFVKEKRMLLERFFSPIVADVTDLAGEFRQIMMKDPRYKNPMKRYELFQRFLKVYWEKVFYDKGKKAAYKKMQDLFNE